MGICRNHHSTLVSRQIRDSQKLDEDISPNPTRNVVSWDTMYGSGVAYLLHWFDRSFFILNTFFTYHNPDLSGAPLPGLFGNNNKCGRKKMTEEHRNNVGKKQPQVLAEMEILWNHVDWIEECVGRLEERLASVLREYVPDIENSVTIDENIEKNDENLVQLASDIKRISGQVFDSGKKLRKIIGRIEL